MTSCSASIEPAPRARSSLLPRRTEPPRLTSSTTRWIGVPRKFTRLSRPDNPSSSRSRPTPSRSAGRRRCGERRPRPLRDLDVIGEQVDVEGDQRHPRADGGNARALVEPCGPASTVHSPRGAPHALVLPRRTSAIAAGLARSRLLVEEHRIRAAAEGGSETAAISAAPPSSLRGSGRTGRRRPLPSAGERRCAPACRSARRRAR